MRRQTIISFFLVFSLMLFAQTPPKPQPQPQPQPQKQPQQVKRPLPQGRPENQEPKVSLDRLRIEFDSNHDGIWSQEESRAFMDQLVMLIQRPHPVTGKLDELFDGNSDKKLDEKDIEIARVLFFTKILPSVLDKNPELRSVIFGKDVQAMPAEETKQFLPFMFDHSLNDSRKAKTLFEKNIDTNSDGTLSKPEIENGKKLLLGTLGRAISVNPLDKKRKIVIGPVKTLLDELVDANKDGKVDEMEVRQATESLASPHKVKNPFDRIIDYDKNGMVEAFELEKTLRAAAIPTGGSQQGPKGPYSVVTASDKLLDLNSDAKVDDQEIDTIIAAIFNRGAGKPDSRLIPIFDSSKNGSLEPAELSSALETLFRPHPVSSMNALDAELNKNGDGFLSPEEIGIAAGVVSGGRIFSFDERLERLKSEQRIGYNAPSSPSTTPAPATGTTTPAAVATTAAIPQLEINLNGKRLAIVSIDDSSGQLPSAEIDGIYLFVQNAFINVSGLKVVERKQLGKVLEEIELALQLGDQNAAASLDKLEGVDVVVVGVLSHVGSKYYLNIRLVSVKDAEILGSSMSDGDSEEDFYNMCSDAVIKMF